jgi:L-fuconolactonase
MPPVPIVDSHVHLWDPTRFRMPWLDGNPTLDRPFGLSDFREHAAGIAVEGIVYLQVEVRPAYALLEAEWVARLHDVEDGERARSFLDALVRIDRRIVGVRRLYQAEPDPEFATRPDFVRGVRLLGEYGLSFDLGVTYRQLPATLELVRSCPDVAFVLDHIGKPDIAAGTLDPWRSQIAELAAMPNTRCKLSGMATEADRAGWTTDDLRPFAEHVLDRFGEDRVMFGGDWPVVLMASPYGRWVETVEALTAGLSDAAKRKLWAENARRFYRLA